MFFSTQSIKLYMLENKTKRGIINGRVLLHKTRTNKQRRTSYDYYGY